MKMTAVIIIAIEVFSRYENKYLIGEEIYARLQERLLEYMDLDEYNKRFYTYPIYNIYYDTEDSHLIRTSLAKPKYKEKLRLRSYGIPTENSKVYVEIKKKFRGMVSKRRSAMMPREAYDFLETGALPYLMPYMNAQVLAEAEYIFRRNNPVPKVFLSYERRAYFGRGDHDLRVSFDTAITTRRTDLRLESGTYGERLLEDGLWLMEIKVARSIPLWLARLLSEYEIYPRSFSKYGAEYLKSAATLRETEIREPQELYISAQ